MRFPQEFVLSQLEVNTHRAHCQTSDIILTLIQSACAHSSPGEIHLSARTAANNKSAVRKLNGGTESKIVCDPAGRGERQLC